MNKAFYPKLAISNLKKNHQTYIPYLIACIMTIVMYFIMESLSRNEGLKEIRGSAVLISFLAFGTFVIAVFSCILLFYTNSFLMKRRKKEIGLYNILGMEKKHIAFMMFFETLFTYLISMSAGLFLGIVLDKLMYMILLKMLHFNVKLGFSLSVKDFVDPMILFGCIFLVIFIFNFFQVHLSNPISLLSSDKTGEKEPKAKIFSTILGIVCLAAGYTLAVMVRNPLYTIFLFFRAVIFVIAGTYLLFRSGSIALLKGMKRNKNYYYKTKNFVSVSSMIYRMKQNAVGLSNICILNTAVILILSTTICLYCGVEKSLETRFPQDIFITIENPSEGTKNQVEALVNDKLKEYGVEADNIYPSYSCDLTGMAEVKGSGIYLKISKNVSNMNSDILYAKLITLDDYNNLTNQHVSLAANEALVYNKSMKNKMKTLNIGDDVYKIAGTCKDYPLIDESMEGYFNDYYIVLSDANQILNYEKKYNHPEAKSLDLEYSFDVIGDKEAAHNFGVDVRDSLCTIDNVWAESREEAKESFYAENGSFLFLGIFLGALFGGATVLIIYYKQISEGFDDRERFHIMTKVGMSKADVKKSIHSQILKVFFLPLLFAIVHMLFAFPMVKRILQLFCLNDFKLFFLCTAVTVLVYGFLYCIVYALTAKTYYKIVE